MGNAIFMYTLHCRKQLLHQIPSICLCVACSFDNLIKDIPTIHKFHYEKEVVLFFVEVTQLHNILSVPSQTLHDGNFVQDRFIVVTR